MATQLSIRDVSRSQTPTTSARSSTSGGIEFLFAQFVDMHGKPSAKLVPAHHIDDLLTDGAGFAGFAAGDIGQGPHDPDMIAMPDPNTLTILPWQPNVARFACDVTVEGEPWPFCPRTILRNQLARAKELGLRAARWAPSSSTSCVRRTEDGAIELADQLDTLDLPCYDMRALTRNLDFVSQVSQAVTGLGWDNYATDHEDANGQFEQNFQFARRAHHVRPGGLLPLHGRVAGPGARADRDVHAQAVRQPDRQRLPLPRQPVADGENVFERDPADDPRGLGLSDAGLPLHRRPEGQRQGVHRASPRRPSTRTSA